MRFLSFLVFVSAFASCGAYADIPFRDNIDMLGNRISNVSTFEVLGETKLDTSLTGPLKAVSGVVTAGSINLVTETTGTLPVSKGGTGSATALNSNRLLQSSSGAIAEAPAITPSRALVSNATGIPEASTVTPTELGYLSGVTSSLQTQLSGKMAGAGTVTDNRVALFNGTSGSALKQGVFSLPSNVGTSTYVLTSNGDGTTAWTAGGGSGNGDVTGPVSSVNNAVTLFDGTTGKLIKNSPVAISAGGDVSGIAGLSANTFTLGTLTGPLKAASGAVSVGSINLSSEVTGTLPIANGGTNSNTALSNNRVMVSNTGAIKEAPAIAASRALASDANGLPVAATTTATELGYVNGVTSSIQTQLNGKEPTISLTANRAVTSNGSGALSAATTTATELGYVNGVTSSIQTQLDSKVAGAGTVTDSRVALFNGTDGKGLKQGSFALPAGAGTSTQVLTSNGDGTTTWAAAGGGGSGDVTGPASSTANALTRFDGTTGKLIKNSTVTLSDTGAVSGVSDLGVTGTLTVGSGSGPLKAASGVVSTGNVNLTSEVTGTLPVANGGTNSNTALSNNRVMVSNSGAIKEASAITASRALASDANGIPVAATTTATELGYVNGVTSSIQTQLNGKLSGVGTVVDNSVPRFDGTGGGTLQPSGLIFDDTNKLLGSMEVQAGNLYLSGNTIYSTNTNGNILFQPNGNGEVMSSNQITIFNNKGLLLTDDDGSNFARLKATAVTTGNWDVRMPNQNGTLAVTSQLPSVSTSKGTGLDISWDATAPTTGALSWSWYRTDNMVVMTFRGVYTNAGASNTYFDIGLPGGAPAPGLPTGGNNEEWLYSGGCGIFTEVDSAPAAPCTFAVRRNSSGEARFRGMFTSVAAKVFTATITYPVTY